MKRSVLLGIAILAVAVLQGCSSDPDYRLNGTWGGKSYVDGEYIGTAEWEFDKGETDLEWNLPNGTAVLSGEYSTDASIFSKGPHDIDFEWDGGGEDSGEYEFNRGLFPKEVTFTFSYDAEIVFELEKE
ncbi:MAG: hypothetical protein N3G21_02555 [Candidatus Hydrogenedentes bacterium]|nr:hypothetical protein [Candidatus Hydrogenedentota bacterium]